MRIQTLRKRSLEANQRTVGMSFIRAVTTKLNLVKSGREKKEMFFIWKRDFYSRDALYVLVFFELVLPILFGVAMFMIMPKLHAHTSHTSAYS